MNISAFKQLVIKNRTYRRFDQRFCIRRSLLRALVDLGRLSASGGNIQPLKYMLACDPAQNALIFPCLAWAGYLKSWPGPAEGERPTAYIVILGDTALRRECQYDAGIAAQSIMLGAAALGLGGCMIGSIRRDLLRATLKVAKRYEMLLVLALGRPAEKVVLGKVRGGNIKYWRDSKSAHHVPKRSLKEIVLG
jgi:nitroreductase